MNQPLANRPESTPPEVEQAEQAWWQKFSEVEDRYCWVQPHAVQRVLREDYLREIIRQTPPNGRILELGCGTGWLCRLLAEFSEHRSIVGIDFSAAQIALAREQTSAARLSDRVQFICADGTSIADSSSRYDTVIVHGFLHHLNRTEIQRTLASVRDHLAPEGKFFIFEPYRRADLAVTTKSRSEYFLRALIRLADPKRPFFARVHGPEETKARALIAQRHVGVFPFGPSPKEMPFSEGELESYLMKHFTVTQRQVCMAISHHVTQAWLLRGLSAPRSTALLLPMITRLAKWLDRKFITVPPHSGVWTFDMLVCRHLNQT